MILLDIIRLVAFCKWSSVYRYILFRTEQCLSTFAPLIVKIFIIVMIHDYDDAFMTALVIQGLLRLSAPLRSILVVVLRIQLQGLFLCILRLLFLRHWLTQCVLFQFRLLLSNLLQSLGRVRWLLCVQTTVRCDWHLLGVMMRIYRLSSFFEVGFRGKWAASRCHLSIVLSLYCVHSWELRSYKGGCFDNLTVLWFLGRAAELRRPDFRRLLRVQLWRLIVWFGFIDLELCWVYQWIFTKEFSVTTCLKSTLCDCFWGIPVGGCDW